MHQLVESAKSKFDKVIERLKIELASLRSGRVTPALVEQVKVEAYGTFTPLLELASINTPEPRLIVVQPWDSSIIKDIERALQVADVGASAVIDGQLIRLNFPALSEDRRREIAKQVNIKLEEARVGVRNGREEILKICKDQKNSGTMSEDIFFGAQKDLQKIVDDYNTQIKKMGDDKEKEVMTI